MYSTQASLRLSPRGDQLILGQVPCVLDTKGHSPSLHFLMRDAKPGVKFGFGSRDIFAQFTLFAELNESVPFDLFLMASIVHDYVQDINEDWNLI